MQIAQSAIERVHNFPDQWHRADGTHIPQFVQVAAAIATAFAGAELTVLAWFGCRRPGAVGGSSGPTLSSGSARARGQRRLPARR